MGKPPPAFWQDPEDDGEVVAPLPDPGDADTAGEDGADDAPADADDDTRSGPR